MWCNPAMGSVGYKYLGRKASAFRSDHCRHDEAVVVAKRVRSWIWITVLWIPVLPVGFRNRWLCDDCGEPTAATPRTRLGVKIAIAVFLAVAFLGSFAREPERRPMRKDVALEQDDTPLWFLRSVTGAMAIAAAVWSLRHRPIPTRAKLLEGFEPVAFESCPLCGGQIEGTGHMRYCAACSSEECFLPLA